MFQFDIGLIQFSVCWFVLFFFFKQKTAYEMRISDWSSDVCSSDLIADFLIAIRADRVRERPGILGELRGAQQADILDPLDRGRSHIGRKALVAKDGEAFLQAQLEPVAAGDAVARPIVKIFMRDDAFDAVIIEVGRGIGIGEDVAGVEDVETLVLHRPHVEITDRDDVEQRSEEHTSELQSLMRSSYAVFCLKKKIKE